jgi:N12 class adenine-specific DNA methylase
MITLLGWCKDLKKKYSQAKLTWKDRKFLNNAIEKKLINCKHKVRLKNVLFKEEGFLENKLKKWENHCKEKENTVKKPLKRKDKTKSNMMRTRIKLSEKYS